MPPINIENVEILDNPTQFKNPFQIQVTFECIPPGIREELEWKLIYVGSADDEKYDQLLDSVLVGPVSIGTSKFVFQAAAPDPSKIPEKDVLEVTVILLTCSYKGNEFIRVGYYVNNDYGTDETFNREPPEHVDIDKVYRNVLSSSPRVTRFPIEWDDGLVA
ncbi:Anti-silencing function protein 1 [Plasmodiophora brassicae]